MWGAHSHDALGQVEGPPNNCPPVAPPSRNQLSSLPACLCRLPLRVLIASNNKLVVLPDDIGALRALRQLVGAGDLWGGMIGGQGLMLLPNCPLLQDVSCNELQALPRGVAFLAALRDLNLRRNRLAILPEGLRGLGGGRKGLTPPSVGAEELGGSHSHDALGRQPVPCWFAVGEVFDTPPRQPVLSKWSWGCLPPPPKGRQYHVTGASRGI